MVDKKENEDKAEIQQEQKVYGLVTNSHYLTEDNKPIPRTRKGVCIVGFAPSSMRDVQEYFNNPDFEIWSINQLYIAFPAIVKHTTRWFQIHHWNTYETALRDHSHKEWMAKQKDFPIYMQKRDPDIPMSIPFPTELLLGEFRRYFTNSISWELALAIFEGFEEIRVYGVDMAQDEEYVEQRPSCEYFCGIADGINRCHKLLNQNIQDPARKLPGMRLYIPMKSDLLKTGWLYPFEDDNPLRIKFDSRRDELRQRVNQAMQNEQGAHDNRMQLLGALENMGYVRRAWLNHYGKETIEGVNRVKELVEKEEVEGVIIKNETH